MQADYDHNDFDTMRAAEADRMLMVKFFVKTRPKKGVDPKSLGPNEPPPFDEVEYIEIRVPGSRDPQACRPATDADKNRFAEHYRMFKQRIEAPVEGWPLSEWNGARPGQVEQLAFLGVKTVEQLIAIPDVKISGMMGGVNLKYRAQKALEERENGAKLREENEFLRGELDELKEKFASLLDSIGADTPDPEPAADVVDPIGEEDVQVVAESETKKEPEKKTTARRSRAKK